MALWFEEWFESEEYLTVYNHRNKEEAEILISLLMNNIHLYEQSRILDLGCGAGRHALLLAKMNYRVTGVDQSAKLLSIAEAEAKKNGLHATFIKDDIRTVSFLMKFELILNVFTSFGYFEKDEDNFLLFANVEKLLSDEGIFAFDFLNAGYVKNTLIPFSKEKIGGLVIEQSRRIEENKVLKEIVLTQNDEKKTYYESVRLYSKDELIGAMNRNNLAVEMEFGSYNGEAFDAQYSPRLIMLCKKKK